MGVIDKSIVRKLLSQINQEVIETDNSIIIDDTILFEFDEHGNLKEVGVMQNDE